MTPVPSVTMRRCKAHVGDGGTGVRQLLRTSAGFVLRPRAPVERLGLRG